MEGKIISLGNLIQYNGTRDRVVEDKIQNTIPAEDSHITYVVKDADGNKKLYGTKFKYNIANTAITTDSGTPIVDLNSGIVNIAAATANFATAFIKNLSITGESTLKEIEIDTSADSDIHSKSWSKVNPSLLEMKIVNKGNLFLYGEFRFRTDTNFSWFRIKSPQAPRSVNATIKDTNLSTTMSAPIVYWDDTYIYIGIKGAFDSGISFTCFF